MTASIADSTRDGRLKPSLGRDDWIMRSCLGLVAVFLLVAILLPLYAMMSKSFEDRDGVFVGFENYVLYFKTPALSYSILNSAQVSVIATVVVLLAGFLYAYALTRTCVPFKRFFRLVAFVPLLTPSLLGGISLIYWFGTQGVARDLLMGESIYGPIGIVLGSCYWVFPHAVIILIAALSITDARLYEAAESLKAGPVRTFLTVTLPGSKYGVISAGFVIFTLVFTDFGVPKVIGGNYDVLATDIYKQVVGQQNFSMGAVVSVVLLVPAALAFSVDRLIRRKQVALLSARAVPFVPKPKPVRDLVMLLICSVIAFCILAMLGMAFYASLVKFWPYNLTLSLDHYQFDTMDGGGWAAYFNSIRMALYTGIAGTVVIFCGAYLVEKGRGFRLGRSAFQFLAMIPLAVPGMVLGLAYIFFFNNPANPFNFLYGTMAILVLSCIAHFYTVGHLTAATALKQMDPEFESVSQSLKAPFYRTFARVTVPVCTPSLLDISIYLFLNAMTTVSAVVFLYSADTSLASVAVLNMDEAGDVAPAAAMAMMIAYTCFGVRMLHAGLSTWLSRRTQAWRKR